MCINDGCIFRFDRFTEAFEHVSGVIDDIYKVCMYVLFYLYLCQAIYHSTGNFLRNFLTMQVLRPFWVLIMEK